MGDIYEYSAGRQIDHEKASSLRQQRVGDPSGRHGFQIKMHGLRPPDHGTPEAGGKKLPGHPVKEEKAAESLRKTLANLEKT